MLTALLATTMVGFMLGQDPNPATTPAERLSEPWWKERHEACVQMTKAGGVDLVFLGDSITQGWEGAGKKVWDKWYADLKPSNFGFSGDRTEHVLWRLEHGEIIGLDPKVVVIMIGTNNIGHGSSNPEQAAEGVKLIVNKLLRGLPKAKILLLAVFPRSESPTDPMRVSVDRTSSLFKGLHDGKRVFFEDIGYAFKNSNGNLRTLLLPDQLHLNEGGYEIWAEAMDRALSRLMSAR